MENFIPPQKDSNERVKEYIYKHWMTLGNLVIIAGLLYKIGAFAAAVKGDLAHFQKNILSIEQVVEQNRKYNQELLQIGTKLDAHISDTDKHMPFEKKSEVFVPRKELDQRLNNIKNTLDRIDAKIDNLKVVK